MGSHQVSRHSLPSLRCFLDPHTMVVMPKLQWPVLPAWMTTSNTASRKRARKEEEQEEEEDLMMEVEGKKQVDSFVPLAKKARPSPPCAQCLAGIPGHAGHLRQG